MGPMWTRGVSTGGDLGEESPYVPRDIAPKYPVEYPPYVHIAWERRFEIFLANQGLWHTISPDAPEIAVISCINDAYLFGHFGEALVPDHRRVWGYISEATAGAPFADRLYECHSVSDALRTIREWALPLHPAERHLLVVELEGVQFMGDEDPNFFFARICRLETTMRAVGIEKSDSDIVQIILLSASGTLRCRENNDFGRPPTDPPETRIHHPFRLLTTKGPRNCETMADGGCAGGTTEPPCSCRRPRFSGRGDRGRRWHASAAAAAAATLALRRWHAAAAAAAATLVSRRWHAATAAAATTLVSRRWHAAAAAAAVTLVSRRWHTAAAAAAATLALRRWHAAAAAAAATLVSRWWHATAAAATAAMVSRRWDSSSAST